MAYLNDFQYFAIGTLVLLVAWRFRTHLSNPKRSYLPPAPLVPLTETEIMNNPIDSYSRALDEYGPVIGIKRNGRREYIVSKEYTRQVLTDESSFSFEKGISRLLGLGLVAKLHGGTYFKDMDSLVKGFLTRRLNTIVPQAWSIFERNAAELARKTKTGEPVDILLHNQWTMAEVTVEIFFGKKYINRENCESIVKTAEDIAELLGLFQNLSFLARRLPLGWHAFTWIKIILFRIPFNFGKFLGVAIWKDLSRPHDKDDKERAPLVSYLLERHNSRDGKLSFASKSWSMILILTLIFASVHQTVTIMTWVSFYLAMKPDCQDLIRDELHTLLDNQGDKTVDLPALQSASRADSFIREVLRMKGDGVNAVRYTKKDVEIGGYMLPKGYLVFPFTFETYRSLEFIESPNEFQGMRWTGTGKSAAMTGPGNLAFGLGRWACPGRFLAIAEIKMLIMALTAHVRFQLEGGQYEVVDQLNITSIPPRGKLLAERL